MARLEVTYTEGGCSVLVVEEHLSIGKLDVAFRLQQLDHHVGRITGSATVKDPLPGVWVQVEAEFAPLTWDLDRLVVVQEPVALKRVVWSGYADHVDNTFETDLPQEAGQWSLRFSVTTDPEIAVFVQGAEMHLQTPAAGSQRGNTWIAVTDQQARAILVLDPAVKDWNAPEALKWSWQPKVENGFGAFLHGWGNPSGVKLRQNDAFGGYWMVVTDSKGLAAIVPYPSGGFRQWAHVVSGNLHSAELLPDGNIALAASTGGWVRIYTSSQGPDSVEYVEYPLKGAHGVLWDPELNLLWALGDDHLVGLRVRGSAKTPQLELALKRPLPTSGGHDLAPVYGEVGRLWVTTGARVYQYDKINDAWLEGFFGADGLTRRVGVKGVGDLPHGQMVAAWPKAGSLYSWTTDTVHLFCPDEVRVRHGAAIYKARIWLPEYQ